MRWFARRPSIAACGRMSSPRLTRQCRASRNLMSSPSGGRRQLARRRRPLADLGIPRGDLGRPAHHRFPRRGVNREQPRAVQPAAERARSNTTPRRPTPDSPPSSPRPSRCSSGTSTSTSARPRPRSGPATSRRSSRWALIRSSAGMAREPSSSSPSRSPRSRYRTPITPSSRSWPRSAAGLIELGVPVYTTARRAGGLRRARAAPRAAARHPAASRPARRVTRPR